MEANTVLKARHLSYQTRLDTYKNLWIQNVENSLGYVCSQNLNYRLKDYQHPATAKAYEQALGLERLRELCNIKERLSTNFVLSAEGKLLEVEFIAAADTSLTVNEIEALETALKSNLIFSINWLDDNEADFVSVSSGQSYDFILHLLQNGVSDEQQMKVKITNVKLTPPPLPDHLKNL